MRKLIAHPPKAARAKDSWQSVIRYLDDAAHGGDLRNLEASLWIVMTLERLQWQERSDDADIISRCFDEFDAEGASRICLFMLGMVWYLPLQRAAVGNAGSARASMYEPMYCGLQDNSV